jgi:hypothetical protein
MTKEFLAEMDRIEREYLRSLATPDVVEISEDEYALDFEVVDGDVN